MAKAYVLMKSDFGEESIVGVFTAQEDFDLYEDSVRTPRRGIYFWQVEVELNPLPVTKGE